MNLNAKFEILSIILTSYRQACVGGGVVEILFLPPSQNKPEKNPPRVRLIAQEHSRKDFLKRKKEKLPSLN